MYITMNLEIADKYWCMLPRYPPILNLRPCSLNLYKISIILPFQKTNQELCAVYSIDLPKKNHNKPTRHYSFWLGLNDISPRASTASLSLLIRVRISYIKKYFKFLGKSWEHLIMKPLYSAFLKQYNYYINVCQPSVMQSIN